MKSLINSICPAAQLQSARFCKLIVLVTAMILPRFASAQSYVITSVSGEAITGTIEAIDEDGKISGQGLPEDLLLDDLLEIKSTSKVAEAAPRSVLHLGGGQIFASRITLTEDEFDIVSVINSQPFNLKLGIEAVKGICLMPNTELPQFEMALKKPLDDLDQLFVSVGDQFQKIECVTIAITDSKIEFEYEEKKRELPIDRIYGLVVAGIGDGGNRKINGAFTLFDGSAFVGRIKSLKNGQLQCNVGPFADIELPIKAVSRIAIRSSRLNFLSDLEPSSVVQKTLIVSINRPWQRDRSIAGNPLTLFFGGEKGEQVYSKGLGMHAGCRLSFKNEGEFNVFAAVIGIDAETKRHGDCIFVVLADGLEIYSQRVLGKDDPRPISVDIEGAAEITLVVEPGENFDLADHADWCEARFLKTE